MIVHVGTIDLTNRPILLTQGNEIVAQVKKLYQSTKIAFSIVVIRKDQKNIDKKLVLFWQIIFETFKIYFLKRLYQF